MDNTTIVETLIAAILPVLINFLKRENLPNQVNAIIAVLVYLIAGVAGVLASGQPITAQTWIATATLFVTVGTVAYTAFWKNFEPLTS
jgi:hypothetical protein